MASAIISLWLVVLRQGPALTSIFKLAEAHLDGEQN